jgi:hypothetical protein
VIVINLSFADRCARCRTRQKGQIKATMTLSVGLRLVKWLGVKFRLCPACADDIVARADANPRLTCVEKRYG